MLAAILSILALALLVALSTLASVLLARFFLGQINADTRIVVAGFGGPGWIFIPFLIYIVVTGEMSDPVTLIVLIAMAIGFIVVGWPISFVATRKLDRLVAYDPKMFE